jgi:hypothetical protein
MSDTFDDQERAYYSTIEELWGKEFIKCKESDFTALRRAQMPPFMKLWVVPCEDDCEENLETEEDFSFPEADLARLVPASQALASVYFDMARCFLSLSDSMAMDTVQKYIHGAIRSAGNLQIRRIGIKHMVTNRMRLRCNAEFLDRNPCLVMVPILTLDQIKNWNGTQYRAIVIAGAYNGAEGRIEAAEVYTKIGMPESLKLASGDDMEIARDSLEKFVLGMAFSLHYRTPTWEAELSGQSREILKELRANSESILTDGVIIPKTFGSPGDTLRVGLVAFADLKTEGVHPPPDPMLLVVRAAVNWSWRNNQKLLASGESLAIGDSDDNEEKRDSDNKALDQKP